MEPKLPTTSTSKLEPPTPPRSNRGRHLKALAVLLVALGLTALALQFDLAEILAFIRRHKGWGLFISVVVFGLLGATPVPSEPLTVFLAAVYGPLPAIGVTTVGNTLSALMEFFIGTNIGDLADFEKRRARLPFGLGRLPINSPVFLLLVRSVPGFGSKFVSIVAGMYRVPLFTYVWTALVSVFFGALLTSFGGFKLLEWWRAVLAASR